MRIALAIVLLSCFAIYHFGYYAFYFSYQVSLENQWKDQIYGAVQSGLEERMMEIPLAAPYMADQDHFQATNTRFEKNGKYYRAIKQRYQNDTLQVVYVPDTARKKLDHTVKRWISFLTDEDTPLDQNGKIQLKLAAKDYLETEIFGLEMPERHGYIVQIGFIFSTYMSPFFTTPSPPPQLS